MAPISDEQLEKELSVFKNIQEVGPSGFFYPRLKAITQRQNAGENTYGIHLQPIWLVCGLTLLLIINCILLKEDANRSRINADNAIETLALSYDQTITN